MKRYPLLLGAMLLVHIGMTAAHQTAPPRSFYRLLQSIPTNPPTHPNP